MNWYKNANNGISLVEPQAYNDDQLVGLDKEQAAALVAILTTWLNKPDALPDQGVI